MLRDRCGSNEPLTTQPGPNAGSVNHEMIFSLALVSKENETVFFFPAYLFLLLPTISDLSRQYCQIQILVPKIGGAELLRGNDVQFLYFHNSCHSEENSLICDIIPYYYYIPLYKRGH